MRATEHLRHYAVLAMSIALAGGAAGQCLNNAPYPSDPTVPSPTGEVTQITGCSYQTEYSRVTGIISGSNYRFTISDGSYITVREGAFNGAVLVSGYSPVTVLPATGADLFAHWNVNEACGTAEECRVTTVQRFMDCVPPSVAVEVENDCANAQFFVNVAVLDTGDASSIGFAWTVDGGAPTGQTGITLGSYQLGPFPGSAVVDLTVLHGDEPACDQLFNDLTNPACPILSCGPDVYTHCYANNEVYIRYYQGDGPYPLRLEFNAGGTSPTGGDVFTIHDGLDDTAPVLYTGVGNDGDLTGVSATSTNPDHALTIKQISSGSWSCQDGVISPEWNYTVGCVDCTSPAASYEVVPDCIHHAYHVAVNVTDLGNGADVRITDSWSNDTITGVGLGTAMVGPIPVGIAATVSVLHGTNALCRALSPALVLPASACVMTACETMGVEHCYGDADTAWFVYQSAEAVPLSISFAAGQMLANDAVRLYNGLDTSAQLVFAGNLGGDLGGLALASSNADNALTLLVVSDASGSCASGDASPALYWTVGCGLVGVGEGTSPAVEIHPNPAPGQFWFNTNGWGPGPIHIHVFDVTGRRLWDGRLTGAVTAPMPIDLGALSPGRYVLKATSSAGAASAILDLVR